MSANNPFSLALNFQRELLESTVPGAGEAVAEIRSTVDAAGRDTTDE